MKTLFYFECCSRFSSGGYCPFCNTRRTLIIDDSQLLQLIKPDEYLEEFCSKFGSLSPIIYRYSARIAPVHIYSYLNYLLLVIPAEIIPKFLDCQQRLLALEQRINKTGVPSVSLSVGELEQIRNILTTLDCTETESEIVKLFSGIARIGILNLLNNAILIKK